MQTIYITWDNGEIHRYKMDHVAVNALADYIQEDMPGDVYARDVMRAGDVQCGAGVSQCAPKPDGYYEYTLYPESRGLMSKVVYLPYYHEKPKG